MFRFSCFNPNHSHKPNKTAQDSVEAMHQTSKDYSQFQSLKEPLDLFSSKKGVSAHSGDKFKHAGHFLKSEGISCKFDSESSNVHQSGVLRKSQSLSHLFSLKCGVRSEDESNRGRTNQQFFCDDSQVHSSLVPGGIKRQEESSSCKYKKVANSESVQVSSDIISDKSSFSIGESHKPEMKGHENFGTLIPGDSAGEFGNITPQAPARMVKSTSMPIMDASLEYHGGSSSEDSQILNTDVQAPVTGEQQREIPISKTENNNYEDYLDDYDDTYNYSGLSKDWIMPVIDEGSAVRDIHDELSFHQRNELGSPDFKNKRIKEWIDSIQHSGPLEESSESLYVASDDKKDVNVLHGLIAPKADAKVSLGMEAAKRYISSLSATASTAQLSNFGLVVIPFLGAFASLRVLNLSGNAIVRITAGALPRGLHALNLSKNKISTIEGLRELARLRVLDLSYNKIIRIGHGLASCSSLKELYLAGNKISEVEGLHRLLKLTVLDLRFNKISTAKCVSQLAANYNSLQAISLEGNPAQKNVGDEQLKKYLQSILPNLAYYNRQTIKGGTLKDAAATERAVRLGMGANQYDRSLRSDHKSTRKSSRSSGSLKPSSSTHARGGRPALSPSKRSKGRRAPVPPPIGTNQRYHLDYHSMKQLDLRPNLLMPRSRSENTLAAF